MLVSLNNNKVFDVKKWEVRDRDPGDVFKYHLDINYSENANLDKIDEYFTDITSDKLNFIRLISGCFDYRNQAILIHGEGLTGQHTIITMIKNIFGDLCCEINDNMFTKGTIRRDIDLYCFKTHRIFIVDSFNNWENFDMDFMDSILEKEKITCKKPKNKPEECEPECTIIFISNNKPNSIQNLEIIELCGIFDRIDDSNLEKLDKNLVFTYLLKSKPSRLRRNYSAGEKFAKKISKMLNM